MRADRSPYARSAAVACAAALSLGAIASCRTTAVDAAQGTWLEVKSPRFQLLTDGAPELASRLVVDLERFHAMMLQTTSAEEHEAAPPLRLVLVKNRRSFEGLTGLRQLAGAFAPRRRGNFAFVDGSAHGDDGQVFEANRNTLFHEYTHYMMAMKGALVPSWYNEGFAEYMATTEFGDDGSYTLGRPPHARIQWALLRPWVPIRRVMEADNVAKLHGGKYSLTDAYAQCWAAVHYFVENPQRKQQLSAFLTAYSQGQSSEEVVQRTLGASYDQLDQAIRGYATQERFSYVRIHPPQPLPNPTPEVRPLSQAEAYYRIGDIVLELSGVSDGAFELLRRSAALAPRDPKPIIALARAHAERADAIQSAGPVTPDSAALIEGELKEAERYLAAAKPLAEKDPERLAVEGHVELARAELLQQQGDSAFLSALTRARKAYRRAIHLDEVLAEAYSGLGATYLLEDQGEEEAIVVLEAAAYLVPLDLRVAATLARVHIHRKNHLQAIPALQYVLRWSQDETLRGDVQKLLDEIAKLGESG